MPLLYPRHRYLGPGNPLNNGEPVDNADKIAQVHDNEYSAAKNKSDIFRSDRKAIKSFARDFVRKPNLPSATGAVGLGIKHGVESLTNRVIYPKITGNA